MTEENKFIDPFEIKSNDLPVIVLSDDRRSFLSWGIKNHSHGNYNHIMELFEFGELATQNFNGFRKVNIGKYIQPQYHLKFYKCTKADLKKQIEWIRLINAELNEVWWKKKYDFLGIVGQVLHIRWIQNPFARYCSERVAEHLRKLFGFNISKRPTPSELNTYFRNNPDFELLGYWWED